MTDEELISKLVGGDRSAADELFTRHKTFVQNVVYSVSKGRCPSDEILQETFTKAFLKANLFDPTQGEFKAWLGVIARNNTLTFVRRLAKQIESDEKVDLRKVVDETSLEQPAAVPPKDLVSKLRKELDRLKSPAREIMEMRLLETRQFDQIARRLDMNVNSVKTIFYRHSKLIQGKLGRRG